MASSKTDSFTLTLPKSERQTLIDSKRLPRRIQAKLEQASGGVDDIELTPREMSSLLRMLDFVAPFAAGKQKPRLLKIQDRVLRQLDRDLFPAGRRPKNAPIDPETVYQFKITLVGYKPDIWRRIQTLDCTLDDLHWIVQAVMGWEADHLHLFRIRLTDFGDPEILQDPLGAAPLQDSLTAWLSEILAKRSKGFRFLYEYDFGDSWLHEIKFEGWLPAEKGKHYPLCIAGERQGPPEDIGGVWGYAELVEAIKDPSHERHEEFIEWIPDDFDPEAFDAGAVNKALERLRIYSE